VFVHATQITSAQRHTVAVEEFEDLDSDLAAIVEPIAEFGGGELPVRRLGCKIYGNFHHLRHGAAKEEMVVRHLVDFAETAEQLQKPADGSLIHADHVTDVADARRTKALRADNQRFHVEP